MSARPKDPQAMSVLDLAAGLTEAADELSKRPASEQSFRAHLQERYEAAHEVREVKEHSARRYFTPDEMLIVMDLADAKAREIIAREALERMGWAP